MISHAAVVLNQSTIQMTDSTGIVSFPNLIPGFLYQFVVHAPGYPNYNTTATLSAGVTPIKIIMAPSPTIGGTGTSGNNGPCDLFISEDGTTPVAKAMTQLTIAGTTVVPGDNYLGTAGQDPAQFIVSVSATGRTLCFSAQTFTVSSPINDTYNGITYRGAGMFTTIFKQSPSFARCACQVAVDGVFENAAPSTTGVQNVTIQNLAIDGNIAARSFIVDDEGIRFDGATNSLNLNIYIDHVYIHNTNGGCIQSRYINHFSVKDFLLENCNASGQGGIYHGLYCIRCWNFIYADGIANGMLDGSGIKIGLQSYDGIVANVLSFKNAKDGYEMSGGLGTDLVHDVTFTGDVGDNNTLNGWDGNVNNGLVRISIALSEFSFNTDNGILMNNINDSSISGGVTFHNGSGWQGLRIFNSYRIAIVGVRSGDVVVSASQTQGDGIFLSADTDVTVSGAILTYGAAYGIELQNNNGVTATGNDVRNNAGAPAIRDDGGNSNIFVRGNTGYDPVGKLTNFIVGSSIGPCGTGTTVVSTTVYTVCNTDIVVTCSAGTVSAITAEDNLGNTIQSQTSCTGNFNPFLNGVWLAIGWKFTVTYSVAPTITVFAN